MGNNKSYLTLEQASQLVDRSVPFLKNLLVRGELEAKLAGGQWLVAAEELEKLREKLPAKTEKVVYDFLPKRSKRSSGEAKQESKSTTKAGHQKQFSSGRTASTKFGNNLEVLDSTVRNLVLRTEIHLAYIVGGKAVYNRIKQDSYKLNDARRETLPKKIVLLLEELQEVKQQYILSRQTYRYKQLLLSLPEWDTKRINKTIQRSLQKKAETNANNSTKTIKSEGLTGYYAGPGTMSRKRYWWNEED